MSQRGSNIDTSDNNHSEIRTVLTTADVGNATQGQRVRDHQLLPISGVQRFCCRWVWLG